MKKTIYFVYVIMAFFFVACGGKKDSDEPKEIVLSPVETEVSGDMEGCFTVVDREYKVVGDFKGLITVEIKRTDKDLPFELDGRPLWTFSKSGSSANVKVGFGIEFVDKDGNVIDKVSANSGGLSGPYSPDECVSLVKLKPGKKGTIRFSVRDEAKEAVGFRITSAYEENESSSGNYSSSDDDEDDADGDEDSGDEDEDDEDDDDGDDVSHRSFGSHGKSSSSSSKDWDALLDSYEKYVDQYIVYVKKAAKGDASALSEYPALMEKAEEFSNKMENAQGEMTPSQWSRYMKITSKMTKAAAEIR